MTVLFADVANFSGLAERIDPEIVHTIMNGCFELLARAVHHYEGTINQFTGDGIMALFGAPLTHEDHGTRALRAALDIQRDLLSYGDVVMRRWNVPFSLRIGVNTGMVVVGRIGDNLRMDYTAQGDTTNVAARLQQSAAPGGVLIGESTRRIAGDVFELEAVGPLVIRGRTDRIVAYQLLGEAPPSITSDARIERDLTPFVGRDFELQMLVGEWHKVRRGHGRIVSIMGEAGLGKSRLLREFRARLSADPCRYFEGSCFTYGDAISYLPFLEILKGLFGLHARISEEDAKRTIEQRLASLRLEAAGLTPYLFNLLAYSVDAPLFRRLPPHLVRRRTVEAIRVLLLAEAEYQPLVVVIEDSHWADKATEEVITSIVEVIRETPLLLILAYRPEHVHPWADRAYDAKISLGRLPTSSSAQMVRAILMKPHTLRLQIGPLSTEHSRTLVRSFLRTSTSSSELEIFIAAKCEGNPLFVEEVTRSLLESRHVILQESSYVFARALHTLDLPPTLEGVLLARIDRLNDELKQVLQAASVIGRVFNYALLAEVVVPSIDLARMVLELEDLDFIVATSLYPSRDYSFKHVLVQEAVYQSLLRASRETYHQAIAEAAEGLYVDRLEEHYELLAHHYSRTLNWEKAFIYLELSNEKATKLNAMLEAKAFFDGAMSIMQLLPDTVDNRRRSLFLLIKQANVMLLLFKFSEYYQLLARFEPIAIQLGEPKLLGPFYSCLGYCEWSFGRFSDAIETETRAASLCEEAGVPQSAGLAYLGLQWSHLFRGHYSKVLELKGAVVRTLEHRFNLRWYTWAHAASSLAFAFLGRWDDAVAEGQRGLDCGSEFGDDSAISFAAWAICNAYTCRGDFPRAIEYGQLAVQKAPTPADQAWAQAFLAWAWCRSGEAQRGATVLAQLVPIFRSSGLVPNELFTPFLCEAQWRAGELDKAGQSLQDCLEIAERCGIEFNVAVAHRLLGEIALQVNPMQACEPLAAPHLERSIALFEGLGAENELAVAFVAYGRLHRQLGEHAECRQYLSRSLEIFERLDTLGELASVRELLADVEAE